MKNKLISRILVLCLILSLVTVLAACGGKETSKPDAEKEEVVEEEPEEEADQPEEEAPEEAAETEETKPEEEAEEAPAESTEEAAETTVPAELLGKQTDSSYINEFFGLRYDAPATWYILSREEIATIMGLTISTFDDESYAKLLTDNGYVTDLYAMDTVPAIEGTQAFNNLNVAIQDIGKLYGIMFNEKQIAEASANSVKEALSAQGMTDIEAEVGEMEFMGKTCVCMTITSKVNGIGMYQKQVYLKNGSALAAITASTLGEDKTDEILAAFKENTADTASSEAAPAEETPAEEAKTETAAAAAPAADAGAINTAALSSGTISVDGDIFTMGTSLTEVNGDWALKPEDAEKYKVYTLNPRTTSGSAMGLYKEKWGYDFSSFHVMVSLMNLSESPVPYLEGTIDYFNIPGLNRTENVPAIVFPGGLTLESTEEDFIAAYGEATYEYDDAATEYKVRTFEDGEVELQITWSKGVISDVLMTIQFNR